MSAPPRKLAGAALATTIAFCILVALGVWQLQRLRWKEGLIARMEAAQAAPPLPLTGDAPPPLFTRVSVSGTWRAGAIALYGAEVQDERMGVHTLQLLDRAQGKPVVVELGWMPTDHGAPKPLAGQATITGTIRLPEKPGWLSASDDLEGRHFYTLDPQAIGAALGAADAAGFTVVTTGLPALPNNHLQYALTWFGLAGALVVVFAGYATKT